MEYLSAVAQLPANPPAQLGITGEGGDREDGRRRLGPALGGQALDQFREGRGGVIGTGRDAEDQARDGEQRARRGAVVTRTQGGCELRLGRRRPPTRTASLGALLLALRHGQRTVPPSADGTARLCTGTDARPS